MDIEWIEVNCTTRSVQCSLASSIIVYFTYVYFDYYKCIV